YLGGAGLVGGAVEDQREGAAPLGRDPIRLEPAFVDGDVDAVLHFHRPQQLALAGAAGDEQSERGRDEERAHGTPFATHPATRAPPSQGRPDGGRSRGGIPASRVTNL